MEFTKIKSNGKEVHLEWTTPAEGGRSGEGVHHKLTSDHAPTQDFTDALQELRHIVGEIIEVHGAWADGLRVIGVSINTEEDGRRGYVVTALKDVEACNAPVVINTPHLREQADEEEQGKFAPADLVDLVHVLTEHAVAYVHGARAQLDIFDEADAEPVEVGV